MMNKVTSTLLAGVRLKICAVVGLALALSFPAAAQWYSGGNLHGKTLYDWARAGDSNKLATAADWYAAMAGQNRIRRLGGIDGMKPKARDLVICMNEASRGLSADLARSIKTSEAAASCMILMGEA